MSQTFEEFNAGWTQEVVDQPILAEDGYVAVPQRPGLGIDLDWERLAGHPYERANLLPLFHPGWEKRREAEE